MGVNAEFGSGLPKRYRISNLRRTDLTHSQMLGCGCPNSAVLEQKTG